MSEIVRIPLHQVEPLRDSSVLMHANSVVMITAAGQGSCSARASFEIPGITRRPQTIAVRLQVERGAVGLGWLKEDGTTWVAQSTVNRSHGRGEVRLFVPQGTAGGRLVFTNGSSDGGRAVAVVEAIEIDDAGQPEAIWANPRPSTLIFLHLPKTAGTTLSYLLSEALPPALSVNDREDLDKFLRLSPREREAFRFIGGHMPYGLHRFIDVPVRYLTFLRDPLDRLVSGYYHAKQWPWHPLYKPIADGMTLLDYAYQQDEENAQTRRLGLYALTEVLEEKAFWWCKYERMKNEHLGIAKEVLNFCDFVGLQECFEDDIAEIYSRLGMPQPPEMPHLLNGEDRPAIAELEPQVVEEIRERNQLDAELYEYARSLRTQRQ